MIKLLEEKAGSLTLQNMELQGRLTARNLLERFEDQYRGANNKMSRYDLWRVKITADKKIVSNLESVGISKERAPDIAERIYRTLSQQIHSSSAVKISPSGVILVTVKGIDQESKAFVETIFSHYYAHPVQFVDLM